MAGKSAVVRVAIVADNSSLNKGLKDSQSKLKSFGSTLAKQAKVAGVAAAAGLAIFAKSAVDAASDAQQSLGATETVFGKFASTVTKTSDQAAKSFGLSANDYRENANLIGSLLKNQGVAVDQLAGQAKQMVGVGADLAATFGGTTSDAVDALSAALKGEFDSLEKYGVSLKQSTVNTEAFRVAGVKSQGAFNKLSTAQQTAAKRQATTNLIMKQSKDSLGAFGRESDTLAHQQQVLGAQFENIKAKVGSAFLPVLTTAFAYINDTAIPAITDFAGVMQDKLQPVFDAVKDAAGSMVEKLQPVADWFKANPEVIKGAAIALGIAAVAAGALAIAMGLLSVATAPITLVIVGLAALGGAIAYAYSHSESFRNAVQSLGDLLTQKVWPALKAVGGFIAGTLLPIIVKTAGSVASGLKPIWEALANLFTTKVQPALAIVGQKLQEWWPTIQKVIAVVAQLYGKWIAFEAMIIGKVLAALIRFAGWLVGTLVKSIITVITWVAKFIGKVIEIGGAVYSAGQKVAEFAANVKAKIGDALDYIRSIPGKVKSAIGDAATWLYDAGKDTIQGFINGIEAMAGDLVSAIEHFVIDKIPGPVRKALGMGSPSKVFYEIGTDTVAGLVNGLKAGAPHVERAARGLAHAATKGARAVVASVKAIDFGAPAREVGPVESRITEQLSAVTDKVSAFQSHQSKVAVTSYRKELNQKQAALEASLKKRGVKGAKAEAALKKAGLSDNQIDSKVGKLEKSRAAADKKKLASLNDEYAKLRAVGKLQDANNVALAAAVEEHQRLADAAAEYAASIKASFVAFGDITQLGRNEEDQTVSATKLLDDLQGRLIKAQQFAEDIKALQAQGLDKSQIDQLLAAGPESAAATAAAIVAGGSEAVTKINQMSRDLAAAGGSLGASMNAAFNDAGVAAAQGLVNGLLAEQTRLNQAAETMANALVVAVRKALGIHSPSTVMAQLGDQAAQGLAIGATSAYATTAGAGMASALVAGFGNPQLKASAVGNGSAGDVATLKVEVKLTAQQLSALERGRQVQLDLDAYRSAGGRGASR